MQSAKWKVQAEYNIYFLWGPDPTTILVHLLDNAATGFHPTPPTNSPSSPTTKPLHFCLNKPFCSFVSQIGFFFVCLFVFVFFFFFFFMALKASPIWVCPRTPCSDLWSRNSGSAFNLRFDLEKSRKWECCCLAVLAQRAITSVEDEKPNVSGVEPSWGIERTQGNESGGFHKDLNLLPSKSTQSHICFLIESSLLYQCFMFIFYLVDNIEWFFKNVFQSLRLVLSMKEQIFAYN